MKNNIKYIINEIRDSLDSAFNELDDLESSIPDFEYEGNVLERAVLIELEDEPYMIDELKRDFLQEHWDKITIEKLESLI